MIPDKPSRAEGNILVINPGKMGANNGNRLVTFQQVDPTNRRGLFSYVYCVDCRKQVLFIIMFDEFWI